MSNTDLHKIQISNASGQTIEEFSEAFKQVDIEISQLSKGLFQGHTTTINLGDVSITKRTSQTKYLSSGQTLNYVSFMFPLKNLSFSINDHLYDEGSQLVLTENTTISCILPEEFGQLLVFVKTAALASYFSDEELKIFLDGMHSKKLQINKLYKKTITHYLDNIYTEIQWSLNQKIELSCAQSYCELILYYLYEYISFHIGKNTNKDSRDEMVFYRGLQFIENNPDIPINMDILSSEIYASKRSIQYAFSKNLNITPMQFTKIHKMNTIRKELLCLKASAIKVTDILYKHNISNYGRFSLEYFELFGERPKDTLSSKA